MLSTIVMIIAQKASYENYKVFRITPTTEKQIRLVRQFGKFHDKVSKPLTYKYEYKR